MTAVVKIIDDNGNPKGVYELTPSAIHDCGISTEYVFKFEYNELKDKYNVGSEDKE